MEYGIDKNKQIGEKNIIFYSFGEEENQHLRISSHMLK